MQIEYITPVGSTSGLTSDVSAVFLRGKNDWFCQYLSERQTRYEGWFFTDGLTEPNQYFKIFERLEPIVAGSREKVILSGKSARQLFSNGTEITTTVLADCQNGGGLQIHGNNPFLLDLNLDMRGIYTQPKEGREYDVHARQDGLLVAYTDPTLAGRKLYLHLRYSEEFTVRGSWMPAQYPWDAARNSGPTSLWFYSLGRLATRKLSVGCGFTADIALANSFAASEMPQADFSFKPSGNQLEIAKTLVEEALQELHVPAGYYAGLPWFHQLWSRDELISGLGLPKKEQLAMIERYLGFTLSQGELPTFAASGTTCADGVGWLALLIREYGILELPVYLREKAKAFFKTSVEQLGKHRKTPSGLIWSGHNATWMDTIGRVGCRLEIQCMYALVFEILEQLTGEKNYLLEQTQTLDTIRHHLFQNGYLADGLNEQLQLDATKRPNIFLAYLLQPELLSHEEWIECMQQILHATQLSWGGLSSVDIEDTRFSGESTGENNISYHNGDSWYFVNNLAALAMHRLDSSFFNTKIQKIIESSMQEILWQGFLGHGAEIAAAWGGKSWGCGTQAWSAGTYIAAVKEIRRD